MSEIKILNGHTLIKIPEDANKIFELNPITAMHSKFKVLSPMEMLYVVSLCDFRSSYFYLQLNNIPERTRREIVGKEIGFETVFSESQKRVAITMKSKKLEDAIQHYIKIQGLSDYLVYSKLEHFILDTMSRLPKKTHSEDEATYMERVNKFLDSVDKREKSGLLFKIKKTVQDLRKEHETLAGKPIEEVKELHEQRKKVNKRNPKGKLYGKVKDADHTKAYWDFDANED